MRVILMMKIYAAVALAILGVRLAFEYLTVIELVQYFGTAIAIGLIGTGIHLFFENRAHKTGKNAINSPNFLVAMIVMTVLISGGIYMLLSYIYGGTFSITFELLFYILFIPAIVLVSVWMYYQIQEAEYNHRLQELKQKNN